MSSELSPDSVFGGASATAGTATAVDLREYLRILIRRRWLIATVFLIACAGSAVYALMAPGVYTSEAVLLIESRPHNVLNIEDVVLESSSSRDFYNTQFVILESRSLAAQVIRKERLPFSVQRYHQRLAVEPIRDSRLVRLRFTSTDPELSARVANAHARAFIQRGLALRKEAGEGARTFLDDTLADLDRRLEASEARMAKFRRDHGAVSLEDGPNLPLGRLTALDERLLEVESERIARGTQLALLRTGDIDSISIFATDPEILQLRQELRGLRRQLNSGRTNLPELLAGEIERLENEVPPEEERVIKALESEYSAVEAEEKRLRQAMADQKLEALRLKDASVEYAMLARESDSTRQLYDVVSRRQKELEMAAELRNSTVFVIDQAVPAQEPSGPSKSKRFAIGALAGLLAGFGLALAIEFLDNSIKTPKDVEALLGISYLGTIPDMVRTLPKLKMGTEDSASLGGVWPLLPLTLPAPATSNGLAEISHQVLKAREAYLSVRTNLLLSQAGAPPSPVLFTSARRGDGKTLTVLNLAVSLAQMGAPALVIDADLRRPSCHEFLGVERQVGLTEVLAGQCEFAEAVRPIKPPLFFLGSGLQAPPDPIELLASERMKAVLAEASRGYAFVLIDSPPLLPISDSVALSPLVDGVVLVISNKTPKPVVLKAYARLSYARARILGAVLNGFDLRSTGEEYTEYYGI